MLAAGAVGCGRWNERQRVAVHGTVTVKGKPVEAGAIAFVPADGNNGPAAGGTIENGEYSIAADKGPVVGVCRVDIYGTHKTGRKVPNPFAPAQLVDEIVDMVPAKYHTNSPLKCDIQPGQGDLDFRLGAK
jgi:hypothetical protein